MKLFYSSGKVLTHWFETSSHFNWVRELLIASVSQLKKSSSFVQPSEALIRIQDEIQFDFQETYFLRCRSWLQTLLPHKHEGISEFDIVRNCDTVISQP